MRRIKIVVYNQNRLETVIEGNLEEITRIITGIVPPTTSIVSDGTGGIATIDIFPHELLEVGQYQPGPLGRRDTI
jgi:hypothetical protein